MYTQEVADKICKRIAQGESLRSICEDDGMPDKSTVLRWLLDDDKKSFCDQYARARESQAEHYLDEIIQIADDCTDDVEKIMTQHGEDYRIKQSAIQRARLQIDTRKWTMSKLAPKKYGDKLALGGDDSMAAIKQELTGELKLSPADSYKRMLGD